jgi:hypothetical protein
MRRLQSKPLTSNTFVNKCLLAGVDLDDWIDDRERLFSYILKEEYFANRLSDYDLHTILIEHFKVEDTCTKYSDDTQLILSQFDICNEQLARHGSFSVQYSLTSRAECLEILVHSKFVEVRDEVARRSYRLDILMHDDEPRVRRTVAQKQYALNILKFDKCLDVHLEAEFQLLLATGRLSKIKRPLVRRVIRWFQKKFNNSSHLILR